MSYDPTWSTEEWPESMLRYNFIYDVIYDVGYDVIYTVIYYLYIIPSILTQSSFADRPSTWVDSRQLNLTELRVPGYLTREVALGETGEDCCPGRRRWRALMMPAIRCSPTALETTFGSARRGLSRRIPRTLSWSQLPVPTTTAQWSSARQN